MSTFYPPAVLAGGLHGYRMHRMMPKVPEIAADLILRDFKVVRDVRETVRPKMNLFAKSGALTSLSLRNEIIPHQQGMNQCCAALNMKLSKDSERSRVFHP